ncbi:hypothetical protein ACFSC6_16755 [Rufibacter sediminis]|uniref:Uncharacterized protein n=1 Tax=Rufibacter sediminis TaxID=2762756 RepID=A0ABR6VT74_9BACT|nr:hypothetical protein [Rufibacter sediminis]MBC3540135.1 hypothetical protein [Rufibacter sediminis]
MFSILAAPDTILADLEEMVFTSAWTADHATSANAAVANNHVFPRYDRSVLSLI